MPILGVGIDIVYAYRIAAVLNRRGKSFASRILSAQELPRWETLPSPESSRFLAVRSPAHACRYTADSDHSRRWCVKEAAYKALYPVARPTWKELTYQSPGKNNTRPILLYQPSFDRNARDLSGWRFHVSVSHDGDYICSSVVVEGQFCSMRKTTLSDAIGNRIILRTPTDTVSCRPRLPKNLSIHH
jgi:holo-[acyl-carrier protein] synthase